MCPSPRWELMTVRTQTAVSMAAAATRFRSAKSPWPSALVTSLWCLCLPPPLHDVAARDEKQSACPAPPIPSTPALMEAPARTDHWGTGRCKTQNQRAISILALHSGSTENC